MAISAGAIVDLLNELLDSDEAAIHAFLQMGVPVSNKILNHPSVVVDTSDGKGDNEGLSDQFSYPRLRPLGLLNGIAAMEGQTIEVAYNEETGSIQQFQLRS